MKNYVSIFLTGIFDFVPWIIVILLNLKDREQNGFLSSIYFFEDLITISNKILSKKSKSNKKDSKLEKLEKLKEKLGMMNLKLPAAVYIPFISSKQSLAFNELVDDC